MLEKYYRRVSSEQMAYIFPSKLFCCCPGSILLLQTLVTHLQSDLSRQFRHYSAGIDGSELQKLQNQELHKSVSLEAGTQTCENLTQSL